MLTSQNWQRLDQLLVQQGLVSSRTRAQKLIAAGKVSLHQGETRLKLLRASEKFPFESRFEIEPDDEQRFVSRAGLKLEGLIKALSLNFHDQILVDIGQSTGGFSDCALQYGARQIIGIEVGHNQLAPKLRQLSNLICLEGVNGRHLPISEIENLAAGKIDGVLMDVSFISQTLLYPAISELLKAPAFLIALVKPQFELNARALNKRGQLRNPSDLHSIKARIERALKNHDFALRQWQASRLPGKNGIQEYFLYAEKCVASKDAH